MLYELAKLFSGKGAERRGHKRKTLTYPIRWMKDENTPVDGAGQEISPTGALFILKEKPPNNEFTVTMKLGDRMMTVRVTSLRHDQLTQNGTTWHRFATKFSGIAADDWDAVVRFVNDMPEPENKVADDLKNVVQKSDDAFRLLPLSVQNQIVDALVSANHLARPGPGQAPLLRMTYSGVARRGDQEIHRCHVHSRVDIEGEIRQYDTTFLIDGAGKVQVQGSR
ncbi:MAG: PilZ domain-containing protein [Candidatus Eremiobacteraeota bacterium]|nr:PilZ domain-containing protein [Candidatus Eremiobacteraeota bacterium]